MALQARANVCTLHTCMYVDDVRSSRALESQPGYQHELVPTLCVDLPLIICAFTESTAGVQEKEDLISLYVHWSVLVLKCSSDNVVRVLFRFH